MQVTRIFLYISDYRLPEAGLNLVQFLEIVLAASGSGYPLARPLLSPLFLFEQPRVRVSSRHQINETLGRELKLKPSDVWVPIPYLTK